jgi:hypothetical protein
MAKLKANAVRVRPAELPQWIKPQLTRLVDEPPDGPDWLHEIKFDGYRMHAQSGAADCQHAEPFEAAALRDQIGVRMLISRHNQRYHRRMPNLPT